MKPALSPRVQPAQTLDLQQAALQEWHGRRRLTAQGQTTGYCFAQTILTQSSMKKKPVVTSVMTQKNPTSAKLTGQHESVDWCGEWAEPVPGMKYGDAEWRHFYPILPHASLG
jgi:hypothetical protein